MSKHPALALSLLGKETHYNNEYHRDLLYPVPRQLARQSLGLNTDNLPFKGFDVWNAFEMSWLNPKGKPVVALGKFIFPCDSDALIESKSFKLYLYSFNNRLFANKQAVENILAQDLAHAAG